MARVPAKRLIPIELLRRSTRGQHAKRPSSSEQVAAQESHHAIKKEPSESKSDIDRPSVGVSAKCKRVKLEPKQSHVMTIRKSDEEKAEIKLEPDGLMEIDEEELDLERTLLGGQSFRWTKESFSVDDANRTVFTGTISDKVLQIWRCDSRHIAYRKLNVENGGLEDSKSDIVNLLDDYFQLKHKLKELYEYWSRRDENFSKCSKSYQGFRILRQDPVENVFCFICATNNNIKRISLMVNGLCRHFGQELTPRDQLTMTCPQIKDKFYTFPRVDRLAEDDVFDVLRYELGFGYRAKFIHETAKQLMKISTDLGCEPRNYLMGLREKSYVDTCKQLQQFPGIGRKVADCICLMSMDHLSSVPIDCHIYEIVCRSYMKTLRQERKSLTEKVHDLIGDFFVDLHGPLAGWATSVLFVAELKHLKQKPSTN